MDNDYGWGIPDMCLANSILINNVSVIERLKESLQLFPNPAKNEISFRLEEAPERVVLTDILGKIQEFAYTSNGDVYTLGLNPEMAAGVYFMTIHTKSGSLQSKFVKE